MNTENNTVTPIKQTKVTKFEGFEASIYLSGAAMDALGMMGSADAQEVKEELAEIIKKVLDPALEQISYQLTSRGFFIEFEDIE